jgi:membrane protein YdbS with pleckstrin-like domain
MDVKTRNFIIIGAGIVFLLIGIVSLFLQPGLLNYITLLVGVVLVILGIVGLKQGKVF